jgi:hypothetical protein
MKSLQEAALGLALASITFVSACGGKKEPAAPAAAPPATTVDTVAVAPAAAQPAAPVSQILAANGMAWTPEAMEDLLAPIALYPDVVLGQTLVAATNPQEVLDAGNWLLQNQSLQGKALDEAARTVGFTPPIRGLLQSPEVVDMMCSQLDWTTELGQAFVNDQQGVLDAVQRLRAQARDVGNLKSSDKMTVGTEMQEGKQVITVSPPSSQVVYVPQYDPVAVYAPLPAAPATTTSTGYSTGAMVATGLLSFGAGILVANIFHHDDDHYSHGYYNPRYYGPPMPYYPPYPYRPVYGGGYHQSNGYYRPPGYGHSYNNNTVIINNNTNNNYWNRHGNVSGPASGYNKRSVQSPITAAKPNRPDLNTLNAQASQRPKRQAPPPSQTYKGQSGYAGAGQGAKPALPSAKPGPASAGSRDLPKLQGSYAGAKPTPLPAVNKPASRPAATPQKMPQATRPAAPPKIERPSPLPAAKPATNVQRPAAPDRSAKPTPPPAVNKPAPRPVAAPQKVPQATRPAVPAAKPAAPTAKPNKPMSVPAKPRTAPIKSPKG